MEIPEETKKNLIFRSVYHIGDDKSSVFDKLVEPVESKWHEDAKYRIENKEWLEKTFTIAIKVLAYMNETNSTSEEFAEISKLDVDLVNKIVKGEADLKLSEICSLEKVIGDIISFNNITGDSNLYCVYLEGFSDELQGRKNCTYYNNVDPLFGKAYNLGALHAIIGDDCRSVDYLSFDEIIKMIRNG